MIAAKKDPKGPRIRLAVLEAGQLMAWYFGAVAFAAAAFKAFMYGLWPYFDLWIIAGVLWWLGKSIGKDADALRKIVKPQLNAGASRR